MAGGSSTQRPLRPVVNHGVLYAVESQAGGRGPWVGTAFASFSSFAAERFASAAAGLCAPFVIAQPTPARHRVQARGQHELLACGHVVITKSDHMGLTVAARRRCRACAAGRPDAWPLSAAWGTPDGGPWAVASGRLLRAFSRATDAGEAWARPGADAHLARLAGAAGMAPGGDGGVGALLAFLARGYGPEDCYTLRSLLEGPWRGEGEALALLTGRTRAEWLDEAAWAVLASQAKARAGS
jgi:hypothetical protein